MISHLSTRVPSFVTRNALRAGTAVAVVAGVPTLAMAQTATTGDSAIDTAVNTGVTTLTGHIGTWAPELIGLAVLIAALTLAMSWVRKRA